MELVAVLLADEVGMTDRGALRMDGGYLGWVPLHVEPDDGEERIRNLVVLGRGAPAETAHFDFVITSADRPVLFELDIELPKDPLWWSALSVPTKALAGVPGLHRIEVTLSTSGEKRSSAWCEYEVR